MFGSIHGDFDMSEPIALGELGSKRGVRLKRKTGQSVVLFFPDGSQAEVFLESGGHMQAKIRIVAPPHIRILRRELLHPRPQTLAGIAASVIGSEASDE